MWRNVGRFRSAPQRPDCTRQSKSAHVTFEACLARPTPHARTSFASYGSGWQAPSSSMRSSRSAERHRPRKTCPQTETKSSVLKSAPPTLVFENCHSDALDRAWPSAPNPTGDVWECDVVDPLDAVRAVADVVARRWKPVGAAALVAMLLWMVVTGNYTPVHWAMEASVRSFELTVGPALERFTATIRDAMALSVHS